MDTKICSTCKEEKQIAEFTFKNKKKDLRHSRCKKCDNNIYKAYYKTSLNRRLNVKTRSLSNIKYNKEFIRRYKSLIGCQRCLNVKKYYMLDFHHIDNTKEANISMLAKGACLETIKKEIRKCIVLCANCHREVHWELNAVVT